MSRSKAAVGSWGFGVHWDTRPLRNFASLQLNHQSHSLLCSRVCIATSIITSLSPFLFLILQQNRRVILYHWSEECDFQITTSFWLGKAGYIWRTEENPREDVWLLGPFCEFVQYSHILIMDLLIIIIIIDLVVIIRLHYYVYAILVPKFTCPISVCINQFPILNAKNF